MNEKQIYWRLRRGVLELDFVFSDFWENKYQSLNEDDKKAFVSLLELQDPELLSYLVYREASPKDPKIAHIVSIILANIDKASN